MNYIRHLNGFFERLAEDHRMSAYHVSLYLALFQLWNLGRFRNPFPVLREELMQIARIGSKTTYSRCIKELDQWGYISYSPSGNWHTGSQVTCIRFYSDSRPESGTGTGTRGSTRTGPRSKTLLLNMTNNYKQDKQEPNKIFENGERKKTNGFDRFHVPTNKDYNEPL